MISSGRNPGSNTQDERERISVIVPSLDGGSFLDACLRSILDQGVRNVEIIVIDGGSQDSSLAILDKYRDRLAWCSSEPDEGPAHAVRKGLARATGEIVSVLNTDDLYLPGALEAARQAFSRGAEWLVGQVDFVDDRGARWPVPQDPAARWTEWLLTIPVCQPGSLWRRSLLERLQPPDARIRHLWDYDLALQLFLDQGIRPFVLDRVLACYRLHPGSLTVGARQQLQRKPGYCGGCAVTDSTCTGVHGCTWLGGNAGSAFRRAERCAPGPCCRDWGTACGPCLVSPGMLLDSEAWRAAQNFQTRRTSWPEADSVFDVIDPW
ncbi:MAG: glycosyltransferase family 2 protein [Pseudomonadota bacterium]